MMDCNKVLESGKLASIGMLMLHWPFLSVSLFVLYPWVSTFV